MILSKKNLTRICVSVGLPLALAGGFLSWYVSQLGCGGGNDYSQMHHQEVVRAARLIPAGTILTPDMVEYESVPTLYLPPRSIGVEDAFLFFDETVTNEVMPGSVLVLSDFQ